MTNASRASYSPDSRVRTSSSATVASTASSSFSASASAASSPSLSASSNRIGRSSSRLRSASTLRISPCTNDSFDVTACAFSWSSHRLGTEASASSSASWTLRAGTSRTVSMLPRVVSSADRRSLSSMAAMVGQGYGPGSGTPAR